MAKAGYTGAQPSRTAREQSYPGAWTGQEQYVERKANTWSLSPIYDIERSLRFNSSDSAYLSRTPASAGNRKTWTWTGWVKRSGLGAFQYIWGNANSSADFGLMFRFNDSDVIRIADWTGGAVWQKITTQVFRDVSAWYHLVVSYDTTNATAADRVRLYVNGSRVTDFSTNTDPALNYDGYINNTNPHSIGRWGAYDGFYLNAYLADIHFIDGQALDPSSFTEVSATTGQLIPKAYTGSFGTNGFWLKFADNSAATATTLGKDSSGLGNNWTPNNLSVTAGAGNDSLVDTPTSYGTDDGLGGSVRGNYCTWNPLTGAITLTNGNLDGNSTGGAWRGATGTAGVLSGKWYWESTIQSTDSGNYYGEFGFIKTPDITGAITFPSGMNGIVYYARNGRKISGGTSVVTSSSGATTGDVVQVAVDLDAGKIWFGVNNTWIDSGNPASGTNAAYTGLSGTYLPVIGVLDGGKCNTNWGARPFAYTAPSGFKALCDTNLPAPVVAKSSDYFQTVLYTGNSSTNNITGLNFSPDLVWLKCRNDAYGHRLLDTVRGATTALASSSTAAESTESTGLTAFNSNGFTLGSNVTYNESAKTYVAWAFDAGTTTTTNTQGSITSQVRANASAGFSIVTYTGNGTLGATFGHGLGVKPGMVIVKNRTALSEDNWAVWHDLLGTGNWLYLNTTAAEQTGTSRFNSTDPSSSVATLGNSGDTNRETHTYVAYCFAPVSGYSSFGSYTGNNSTDGPFVYTGFRPRWILIKAADIATYPWEIYDTTRSTYNVMNVTLAPNTSNSEPGQPYPGLIDVTANGFKIRSANATSYINYPNGTYIYAAFAEFPFQYARAR